MAIFYFEIGPSLGTSMINIEAMTTRPNMSPEVTYLPYGESVPTGDGGRHTRGSPVFLWDFGFIDNAMISSFNAIAPISAGGGSCYIRTCKEDDDHTSSGQYAYYSVQLQYPELESYEYRAGFRQPFTLRFVNPVVTTP